MTKLTASIARAEITRRKNNRAHKGEQGYPEPAGPEILAYVAEHGPLTGAHLAAKGTPRKRASKTTQAPAVKTTPEVDPEVAALKALRKQADAAAQAWAESQPEGFTLKGKITARTRFLATGTCEK